MSTNPFVFAITLAVLAPFAAAQTFVYVDDDAPPGGAGTSWASAHCFLQDAVNTSAPGSTILVAGGHYRPDQGSGITLLDRNASLRLKSGTALRGGYRGLSGGGSPDDRDLVAFETVIDGDLGQNGTQATGDDSYHLFWPLTGATGISIDGMTWRFGNATGFGTGQNTGGGILQASGSLHLSNLRVEHCRSYDGGGVYFTGPSITVNDCTFVGCIGIWSGSCLRLINTVSDVQRIDCSGDPMMLVKSQITQHGGALEVRNSRFSNAVASVEGAAIDVENATALVEDCRFEKLISQSWGGALFARTCGLTVRRCTFFKNSTNSSSGSAVYSGACTSSFEDCVFDNNLDMDAASLTIASAFAADVSGCRFISNEGGGIEVGSGSSASAPPVTIRGCEFLLNRRSAISSGGGNQVITRCVFVGNDGEWFSTGSALRLSLGPGQHVSVDHCTITEAARSGTSISFNGSNATLSIQNSIVRHDLHVPSTTEIQVTNQGLLDVRYSDIEGLPPGLPGLGNFDSFPRLFGPLAFDLNLRPGSPCIDAGDPSSALDPDGTRADVGALAFDPQHAIVPRSFCQAGTSSSGCTAALTWSGTPSASASSPFTLSVNGANGISSGLIFYGITRSTQVPWGTTGGARCVGAPFLRTPVQTTGGTAALCDGSLALDWNLYVATHPTTLGAPFTVGDAIWAQGWYRDPPSPKGTQMSNAIEFVLED